MTRLHDLTALEQAALIKTGEVTAVELTEYYLDRSQRLSDQVGAFVTIESEPALRQAQEIDQSLRSRANASGQAAAGNSPLLGVVCPIKDLNLVAGMRCRFGSAAVDLTPDTDDVVVAKLRAAGLIFTGKTNTPEFGLPCYTEPDVAPPARTPWDLDRSASGSSGGAAAAVAAGLAPLAQGNDGGGSIRTPAAVAGLVGIKPSRGRISNGPAQDIAGDLVVQGPLARTVADAAAVLDAMSGFVIGDPYAAPEIGLTRSVDAGGSGESGGRFLAATQRDPGSLRIGYYVSSGLGLPDPDPLVITAVERTATLLTELGHRVEPVTPPFDTSMREPFETVWYALAALSPIPEEDEPLLRPLTRYLRSKGERVSGVRLARALHLMRTRSRFEMSSTQRYDAVVAPTLAQLPAPIGRFRNDQDPAADFAAQLEFNPYCSPYNVTGQPTITIPLNWTESGLPVGVQLAGRLGGEETIISLAAQLERAQPWAHRRPAIWLSE